MRSKNVLLLVIVLLVSAGTPTALAAAEQERVGLTVTVVDQSGERVSGATLVVSWDGGNTTETTRSNGEASFDVPGGTSVAIDLEDAKFVRNVPTVVSSGSGREVTIHVAKKGSTTLRVESASGEALGDARVDISRDGHTVAQGTTDDSGRFSVDTIEQGDYQFDVVKSGYYSTNGSLAIHSSDVRQAVTVESGEVTARFRVVDDHFDDPKRLSGATVAVGSLGQFDTADDGSFAVTAPVNTELDVRVSKDGYQTASRRISIGERNETSTLAVQRIPALSVAPATTQVVVNQTVVMDVTGEYGNAVEGATIRVDGEAVGTTDGQGSVSIPIDSAGAHNVTAVKSGVTSDAVVIEGVSSAQNIDETATNQTATTSSGDDVTTTSSDGGSSGTGPGFTAVVALAALLATVGLLARRR